MRTRKHWLLALLVAAGLGLRCPAPAESAWPFSRASARAAADSLPAAHVSTTAAATVPTAEAGAPLGDAATAAGGCPSCEGCCGDLGTCGLLGLARDGGAINCNCNGSYKFPVPPLYTYHWPGMYSQQLMTDYHSPWRFPALKPYVDEPPVEEIHGQTVDAAPVLQAPDAWWPVPQVVAVSPEAQAPQAAAAAAPLTPSARAERFYNR